MDRQGGPEVYRIGEVPIPEPGEGEVLVRVDGAGMNPVDWKIREGQFPSGAFPAIGLREFSGTITKLGAGVEDFEVGQGVYGITERGAAAEFTVARQGEIGPRPASLDPVEAGMVPLAAMTAWQALFEHGNLQPGQRVLIHAAAGGVGTFAVQLAKFQGAYVIGTASAEHHEMLKQLGADKLIDYRTERFEDVVSNVDLVLHSIGDPQMAASMKVLKPGGKLVSIYGQPDEAEAKRQNKFVERFMMQPHSDELKLLAKLIDDRRIHPVIDEIVPFEQATAAMNEVQHGHGAGKIGIRLT